MNNLKFLLPVLAFLLIAIPVLADAPYPIPAQVPISKGMVAATPTPATPLPIPSPVVRGQPGTGPDPLVLVVLFSALPVGFFLAGFKGKAAVYREENMLQTAIDLSEDRRRKKS